MPSFDFGKEYLLLGLRMDKLIDGFVDAYYGPSELKALVESEKPLSPKNLLTSCKNLQKQLYNQGFTEERVRFLEKTLGAIETSLNINIGEDLHFLDKVERLYDIKPELIEDSIFYKLKEKLDSVYKGSGPFLDRFNAFWKKHELSKKQLEKKFTHTLKLIRDKTYELFQDIMPENEEISIKLVKNKPWRAYNWYLGQMKSRIEINTDIPFYCMGVLKLITHEAYPGHHTEHVIKEKHLFIDKKRFEHCILLIPTPESVISEGIGNTAADFLFSDEEKGQIILEELCHDPSNNDLEIFISHYPTQGKINKLLNNLAILAYVNGWSDDKLIKYALDFELIMEKEIRQTLKFIRHPLWSTYIFNYSYGETLIKQKFGTRPSPKDFKMLLTHPILPSDLE
ncbi:MAG: hypothetical protein ACFE9Q_14115 [Candidatus Hodarchaeota archaeon]